MAWTAAQDALMRFVTDLGIEHPETVLSIHIDGNSDMIDVIVRQPPTLERTLVSIPRKEYTQEELNGEATE